MFPRLWKVISTGWPCRTCSTGPGTVPLNVQARKRTPGAISTVRSSTVISKRATVPPTGAGRWAGNGTSVRPPCARSRRLRRSGAAAELRDGRKRAPAESAPRPPRSMLRRDVAGSCKAAGRCTARSSLSGSLAPVSIAALLELIDGVYAHPSLSVWVVAPVSAPILLKTFRLTARPEARDQRPRALPRVGEIHGRTVSPPLAAGTHCRRSGTVASHPLAKRERPCSGVGHTLSSSPSRAAGCPAAHYADGVKSNRSIPQSTVIPVLIYPDVRAAVAWLSDAFGFAERVQIGEDHRSQMSFGDGRRDHRRRASRPPAAATGRGHALGHGARRRCARPLRARQGTRSEDPHGAHRFRIRRASVLGRGPGGPPVDVLRDTARRRSGGVGRHPPFLRVVNRSVSRRGRPARLATSCAPTSA